MKTDRELKKIVALCLLIDRKAHRLYLALSDASEEDELKLFWKQMSLDEKRHIAYWEAARHYINNNPVENPFDDPASLIIELESIEKQAETLFDKAKTTREISDSFLMAYRMEFYALHPAFQVLFQNIGISGDKISPEDDYEDHLNKFIKAFLKYGDGNPELELAGDLLKRLFVDNKNLARQLTTVKQLRGLLPICSNCKSIRDDQGYWNKIEAYINEHADVEFTHSICPKCVKDLYPDFIGKSQSKGTDKSETSTSPENKELPHCAEWNGIDRRKGKDRRCGTERRTSTKRPGILDIRSGKDRRSGRDRRIFDWSPAYAVT